ncbi:MAG: hypothetical protein KDI92_11105 [Xanthomonadales bacterium]|nr:hypothetical protein [Xanthomonadales bacterium]
MWIYIKSLFMVKDRSIAKEMVEAYRFKYKPAGFKLARLLRRRGRRNKFKALNTTQLKFKVK